MRFFHTYKYIEVDDKKGLYVNKNQKGNFMAFIKNWSPKIGERVITTRKLSNCAGYMERGTEVTITDIGDRGYDLVDDEGNRIIECGWDCVRQIK